MGRWGDGEMGKYLVMVEDGTFFYTELNGFDIIDNFCTIIDLIFDFYQMSISSEFL
ncbi:hypothetical protein [Okeania hirsuta]|uniref:hypothetical protein n=1 Tax=Okeania hirsuta TaxID=1458930 RepID=UPI001375016C|nr:hypothetical protein [Okeania hirsuta]